MLYILYHGGYTPPAILDFQVQQPYNLKMLNVGGVEGLEQDMSGKSAFMELQQQAGMPPGMGHPAYPIRSSYQHHHGGQHGESVFSNSQGRALYPFHMNAMSPSSYQPPTAHPFPMPPYQSPSPTREGKFFGIIIFLFIYFFPTCMSVLIGKLS